MQPLCPLNRILFSDMIIESINSVLIGLLKIIFMMLTK